MMIKMILIIQENLSSKLDKSNVISIAGALKVGAVREPSIYRSSHPLTAFEPVYTIVFTSCDYKVNIAGLAILLQRILLQDIGKLS